MTDDRDPNVQPRGSMISWTVETTQALEVSYKAAVEAGQESFVHDGQTYVTRYAMYLIQYLAGEFQRRGLWPIT